LLRLHQFNATLAAVEQTRPEIATEINADQKAREQAAE